MTSLITENVKISATNAPNGSFATFLFLPYFNVICDLLLNRRTATWNLFVKWFVQSCNRPIATGVRSFNDQKLTSQFFLAVDARSIRICKFVTHSDINKSICQRRSIDSDFPK